jgi:hypothetical protein
MLIQELKSKFDVNIKTYALIALDLSAISADNITMNISYEQMNVFFTLLDGRLQLNRSPMFSIVVCGGTALNALHLVQRTTKDVDIVALLDSYGNLADPAPLPNELLQAAKEVADTLNLQKDWLNNGPSRDDGGLFRLGLPEGFKERLTKGYHGPKLTVFYISRLDQIHFKLYAAVDQFGSYHAADLKQLDPTDDELLKAARWSMTHDPSEGFKMAMKMFLEKFGYERLAEKI